MSVTLTINAASYTYPEDGDKSWGDEATAAMQALALYAVYTTATQTMTNKTLTAPTITGPTISGTVAGGASYTAPTIAGGTCAGITINANSTITATNITVAAGKTIKDKNAVTRIDEYGTVTTGITKDTLSTITNNDATVTDTDGITTWAFSTGNVARTLNLPTAADNTNRVIRVYKTDSGTGTVTVDGENAETINGVASIVIENQYCGLVIQCDGSGWIVIGTIGECYILTIGSAVELVYRKLFTGTTDADSETTFAHGVTGSKIVNLTPAVFSNGVGYYVSGILDAASAASAYDIYYTATNIVLTNVGANLQSQAYRVGLEYYI